MDKPSYYRLYFGLRRVISGFLSSKLSEGCYTDSSHYLSSDEDTGFYPVSLPSSSVSGATGFPCARLTVLWSLDRRRVILCCRLMTICVLAAGETRLCSWFAVDGNRGLAMVSGAWSCVLVINS